MRQDVSHGARVWRDAFNFLQYEAVAEWQITGSVVDALLHNYRLYLHDTYQNIARLQRAGRY